MPVKKKAKPVKPVKIDNSKKENKILKNENKFLNASIDELKTRLNTLDSSKDQEREIVEKHFNEELLKAKEIIQNSQKENEELSNELTKTQQQFKKLMLQIQQQKPDLDPKPEQSGSFLTKKIMDLTPQEVIEGARVVKELVNPSTPVDPMQQVYLEFGKQVVGDTLTQLSKNVFAKKVATEQSQTIREATTGVQ